MGLQWNLHTIGRGDATQPFRFSLCEGRYLAADEVSRPCNQFSRARTVNGGHNAPFVFSAGHGTPLPPGLSIDGNGILKGDDPALLSELERLPLCVRQLDVERCKPIEFGENTRIVPDPIAKAIDNGSGAPKKGMGAGGAFAVIGGLALAAGGIAVAASALQVPAEEDSSCGPKPTLVVVSAGGQPSASSLAAYREWCVCQGYRTATTASNGDFTCVH